MNTLSIGGLATLLKSNRQYLSRTRKASYGLFLLTLMLPAVAFAQVSKLGAGSSTALLTSGATSPLTGSSPSIKFEQAQNGGVGRTAVSPVNWVAGNGSGSNSHYSEGQSIPYRLTLSNVEPGTHTVIIEWDLRRDKKTAIDYITSFQRIGETVDPLRGLSGNYGQPGFFTIPAPQRNKSVTGNDGARLQPAYSFNKLQASERQVAIYNASPTGASYFYEGDPGDWYAPSKMKFTFKVTGTTPKNVVLAWGGHIASRADWGTQNVFKDLYSSPYRTMIISLDTRLSLVDRSLQVSALQPGFIASCEVKGGATFCSDIVYQYSAVTNISSPNYQWTVTGGIIQKGQGTSVVSVKWDNVPQASVAVKIKDQNSATTESNCSLALVRDVVCPYYTPSVLGKVETIIGSELTSLHANFQPGSASSNFIYTISNDKVFIEVIPNAGEFNSVLNLLRSPTYGLTGEVDNDNTRVITGFFPIVNLPMLNELSATIKYVRPAYPPVTNGGITTTKGDIAQHSDLVRQGYDVTGKGIKIGVLSDSYNQQPGNPAAANVANGDVPPGVRVFKDLPGGTDEGRAIIQNLFDVAPGAKFAFRTGSISSGDFAKGIKELQLDTCDIIVDDLTYLTEPFFQDGQVANTVDLVTSQGVTYFTSAGNFGNRSYASSFAPLPAPTGVAGMAHDFGGGDIFQKVTLGAGTYTIVLQWEDPFYSLGQVQTGSLNDLDIYLTNDQGATLFGFNRNNLGADPIEVLPFTAREDATTNIMIVRSAGTANVPFRVVVFRGDKIVFNEHNDNGSSTIVGQANSKGAITVGAVLYSNTEAFGYARPADAGQFTVASFSSVGGNKVQGEDRQKPDIIAPNGGNTTVRLGGLDVEYDLGGNGDGFFNFFGTSAAAPHAAGVAALLMEARKKYYNGERYSPAGIRQALKGSALNMYEAGYDVKSGAGFIQADVSMRSIAAPLPSLVELSYDTASVVPGESQFLLTVAGKNLTPESKVLMRDVPLPTTYIGPTQLQAVVGPFEGNPAIHVYTAAITPSGQDGGGSDTLYFKDRRLIDVRVVADRKTKKYGEFLPEFTATVLIDGDTITSTTVPSLADLGLTQLQFETPATSMSNADTWKISVTATLTDILKEVYRYEFVDGVLVIEKLPIVIKPNDLQARYGEKFDDKITFSYQFNGARIADVQAITDSLELDHKAIIAPNVVALFDLRALPSTSRVIVNADLQNLSFLATSRVLANSRILVNRSRVLVNTTNVVDFDRQSMVEYFDSPDTANLITPIFNSKVIANTSRALVNSRVLANSRVLVNYSRILVNTSRVLVNSRILVNGAAVVNSETVGANGTSSNRDAVVIVDSLDVFNSDPPIIDEGNEVYELPQLYSINAVSGLTAGNHFILPAAYLTVHSNNFDVSYATGNLTIKKDTLIVTASSAQIPYGIAQPSYTATVTGYQYDDTFASVINSIDFTLDLNGNPKPATGIAAAGTYKVVPTANLKPTLLQPGEPVNYFVKVTNGTLTVSKVPLIVKANNVVITAGETPQFTAVYTGLVNNDMPVSVQFTTSYTGSPGIYTITPKNAVFTVPGNYDIQYQTGTLYVNPKTNLCKAVRPVLLCVEEISDNPNYKFKAHFEYVNENSTALYIPIGPDNLLVSAKAFSGTQPELLQPGGGSFEVLFNGDKLTWTLTTYDKGKKTSVASSASSTSSRCKKVSGGDGRELVGFTPYPNPTDRYTTVLIPNATNAPSASSVQIVDQWGRRYSVVMDWSATNLAVTFDFWGYPRGYYVISIQRPDGTKMMRVYKN